MRTAAPSANWGLRRACSLVATGLVAATLAAAAAAAPYRIAYTVTPQPAATGQPAVTHVRVDISGLAGAPVVELQMAAWSPGDYHVMNHAQYVRDVKAVGGHGDAELLVTHPDANTWSISTAGSDSASVSYDLPNTPAGFFSDNVRVAPTWAFYNGPATYVYVVGHKADPATLHVVHPVGWQHAVTPLPGEATDPTAPNADRSDTFRAPDFDTLADSPLLVGAHETRTFSYLDRLHTVVFFDQNGGPNGMDYESFVEPLRKIAAEEDRLMGGAPYERYDYFVDVGGAGGGLEHLNAQRVAWRGRSANGLIGLYMGHEFFHLWNVKRIRPVVLGPFDYIHPPRTHNLWFCEGVTDYFAGICSLRAALVTADQYLSLTGSRIQALNTNPARLRVTADEASWRVWESGNSDGYGGLSYYLKGDLIGLCMDLKLRQATGGRIGLEAVMRDLLARYGLPKPGYPEDGIRDAVIRAGGAEMAPFYDRLARSTDEMPFAECLGYAGLTLRGDGAIAAVPNPTQEQVALRQAWLYGK